MSPTPAVNQVLELPAGPNIMVDLPFTGLSDPQGVAIIDSAGDLTSPTGTTNQSELAAGFSTQAVAAVHRAARPLWCGGGRLRPRKPLRRRPVQQSGGEKHGGVMRRTAGARGCRASPTEAT